MAIVTINDTNLTAIADSIRGKNGLTDTYKPSEMAAAIDAIAAGGGDLNIMEATLTTCSSDITTGIGINLYDYVDNVEDVVMMFVRTSYDTASSRNNNFLYMKGYGFIEDTTLSPYSTSTPGVAFGVITNPYNFGYSGAQALTNNTSIAIILNKNTGILSHPFKYIYNSSSYTNNWANSASYAWGANYAHIWILYK